MFLAIGQTIPGVGTGSGGTFYKDDILSFLFLPFSTFFWYYTELRTKIIHIFPQTSTSRYVSKKVAKNKISRCVVVKALSIQYIYVLVVFEEKHYVKIMGHYLVKAAGHSTETLVGERNGSHYVKVSNRSRSTYLLRLLYKLFNKSTYVKYVTNSKQCCGSAFFFCKSGSGQNLNADPDP